MAPRRKLVMGYLGLTLAVVGLYCLHGQKIDQLNDGQNFIASNATRYESKPFHIKHTQLGKYAQPLDLKVPNNTPLAITGNKGSSTQFTFTPAPEKPGYGYIRHKDSGKYLVRNDIYPNFQTGLSPLGLWKINSDNSISHSNTTDFPFWKHNNGDYQRVILSPYSYQGWEIEPVDAPLDLYSATFIDYDSELIFPIEFERPVSYKFNYTVGMSLDV